MTAHRTPDSDATRRSSRVKGNFRFFLRSVLHRATNAASVSPHTFNSDVITRLQSHDNCATPPISDDRQARAQRMKSETILNEFFRAFCEIEISFGSVVEDAHEHAR